MISGNVRDEISVLVERLRSLLDELTVRGLANAGNNDLHRLSTAADELHRLGAGHLSASFKRLAEAIGNGERAGAKLFRARTALQLFESLTSYRVALSDLQSAIDSEEVSAHLSAEEST